MKRYTRFLAFSLMLASTGLLSACAHKVTTEGTVLDRSAVFSAYDSRIPGKFAIYVQTGTWSRDIHVNSWDCWTHRFTIDADDQFYDSFTQSLANMVEQAVIVPTPLSQQELSDGGYRAQIAVHAGVLEPELKFRDGFLKDEAMMKMVASAHLVVLESAGVLMQTTVEALQSTNSGRGFGCTGGARAVANTTALVLRDLIGRTAERLNSLPTLRQPLTPQPEPPVAREDETAVRDTEPAAATTE